MTKKQILYFFLCVPGTVLPYSQLVRFLNEHGLDFSAFFHQLFVNGVSGFFGLDVIVSSLALWVFVYSEGMRLKMGRLWIYIAANLLVGVSLGLPLFLLMREYKLDESTSATS